MNLRLYTLSDLKSKYYIQFLKLIAVIFIALIPHQLNAQSSEADLKKQAEQLFEDEEYTAAYKLYAQLVSNYPKDPLYNYRLGVCMIYSEPDKKKSFSYLRQAYINKKDLPNDVTFFYGKAFHINYQFDEAIKYYNEFKNEASSSMQKKLQVDKEIRACGNGKRLLSALTDLVVLSKKQLNEQDYFRSYDLSKVGGKLLVKPEEFKTGTDKKRKDKSVLYLPKDGDKVFYSSYGEGGNNGKDIFYKIRMADGTFSKPVPIDAINTEFDEDYPFIHPNGKTLYFASKGHNSMGGYDIFKTTYNESTQSWTTPKNMEFPINSPDDDYLYVTDSLEKNAYFSTGRYSPPGKIDVLKIKTERKPIDFVVIKGTVARETMNQSVRSIIKIKNISTGEEVGVFQAQENGNFFLNVPNGAKLLYTVETPDLPTQSQGISLPLATVGKPFKQTITYENKVLKILNNFEEAPSDDDYLQYLQLIEEKAKLNPNEGKNQLTNDIALNNNENNKDNNETTAVNTNNPTINNIEKNNNTVKPENNNQNTSKLNNNLSNTELISIAKQDAIESEKEAVVFKQDSRDAFDLGESKKIESAAKLKEAQDNLTKAETIDDNDLKKDAVEKANAIITQAQNDLKIAENTLVFAKALENDANRKAKEAQLNKEYVNVLEKIAAPKGNTPENKTKLNEIQNQLADIADQKNESDEIYAKIRNEITDNENTLSEATKNVNTITNEIREIKNAISESEADLAKAKRKEKEEIKNTINELNSSLKLKEDALANAQGKEEKASATLNANKDELAVADKIKTENIAKVEPVVEKNVNENPTTSKQLEEKYYGKTSIGDQNNLDNITEVNNNLKNYNKEIDNLIAKNKTDLVKEKNATNKKTISTEIKNLEATKKQNQQSIANNNNRINDLNKQIASGAAKQNNNENLKPINTENPNKALEQIKELKTSLTQADNQLFNYNNYSNTEVQNQKITADQQINDAFAQQNKLKETIAKAEENIKNVSISLTKNSNNPDELLKQSDELLTQAQKARSDANTKQGDEKTNLLIDAVNLEKQAEKKQIEASEAGSKINIDKYDVNKENLQSLLATNNSPGEDAEKAKELMNEAEQSLKQAKAIREEANAINNNAAKIGNLGNAEEKELIALTKQNEAIELLKKSNSDVALKPYKDNKTVNITSDAVIKEEIAKINNEVNQLIETKYTAYNTLSKANDIELNDLNNKVKNSPVLSSDAKLKTQYAVIDKKLSEIETLKNNVNNAGNTYEKLVVSTNLVKKQNEVLAEINKLNESVEQKAVALNKTANENKTNENNKENNAVAINENNKENNQTGNKENTAKTSPTPTISPEKANTAFSVDLSFENHKDTSIQKINSYFSENDIVLRNSQANTMKDNSLSSLKSLEPEFNALNNQISNSTGDNNSSQVTPEAMKGKIEELNTAADNLADAASRLRTDAESKTGDEKESLLSQAKNLDEKSTNKRIEASILNMQYNEASYNANLNAINDLLASIKDSKPNEYIPLKEKADELLETKKHTTSLREDANAINNNAAKLGAISNAEEEEFDLLNEQNKLINELKTYNSDYVVKGPSFNNISGNGSDLPPDIKQKQEDLFRKQYNELTTLTNAYSLEYETNKNALPKNLTAEQNKIKNNIIGLNNQSKSLLIKSSQATDWSEKIKLVSLAAKTGHAAATQLNVLINKEDAVVATKLNNNVAIANVSNEKNNTTVVTNNKTNENKSENKTENKTTNNVVKTNEFASNKTNENKTSDNKTSTTNENNAGTKVIARVEGLEVLNKNAYNENKPIPMNAKMPDGLMFRVQIGAFRNAVPNNSFRGLTPVNGETTANGFIRYTAGNFNKFENAAAVKSDLNNNGYPDAFVVAFFNGKRITINEALEILANEGKTVNVNAPNTAGIKENVAPLNVTAPKTNNENLVVAKELEKTENLLFTVQIGVYSKLISKDRLSNLSPIYSEKLASGLYRYTAGIYNNTEKLVNDKNKVVSLGIKDAFVTAYLNGKKISYNEAKDRQNSDLNIKLETENPIVFPAITTPVVAPIEITPIAIPAPTVAPFTNSVSSYPEATEDNGVKSNEEGVSFKVQIGAYSKQVPNDVAAKFNSVKNWPIENKVLNGLYLYNIGNFTEAKFAKQLKEEAISLGITDAFITVYKDGKKLFGQEAASYINK